MATKLHLKTFVAAFVGAALLLVLLASGAEGATQEAVDESAGAGPHVAGELLVTYESGVDTAASEELPEETAGEVEEELPELDTQVIEFPQVKNRPSEDQRERLLQQKREELQSDPAVQSVSYNYVYKGFYEGPYTPNDPRFGAQYGLESIEAPRAWGAVRGEGVDIAIVDTGISNAHPDLEGKISAQANCVNESKEDLSCVEGPGSAEDDNGHGTEVAGVAAAATGNGKGIAGTCPDCRLLVAKSLSGSNTGKASDIAGGIVWSTDEGAEVINLSLGAEGVDSPPIEKAINRARKKGAVVVAAAGNFGRGSGKVYPAAYRGVVAVAATNRSDRRAPFSSTGGWVDVAAPGVGVLTTKYRTGYGRSDGTSLSSPYVAGVAGMLAAQGRSEDGIRRKISSTAVDRGPRGKDAFYGHGLVDAAAAVGVRNTRPRVQRPRPVPGSQIKQRRPTITALVKDRETDLKKSDIALVLDGRKRAAFSYNTKRDRLSYRPAGKLAPDKHEVRIVVRDEQGKRAVRKWTFQIRAPQTPKATGGRFGGNGPFSTIRDPRFPFNVLPEDPIFDTVRS